MAPRSVFAPLLVASLAVAAACDETLTVGEPKPLMVEEAGIALPANEAGAVIAPSLSWRRHGPDVPCTIYALDEQQGDDLYIGCTGGMLYRFDGTTATLVHTTDEKRTFNLLWLSPKGEVWAAAQAGTGYEPASSSELHHFDGKTWSIASGPFGKKRIMALTGVDENVWLATTGDLYQFDGTKWTSRYTITKGEIRSCELASANLGFCSGTDGLALVWDGKTWTELSNAPWSSAAEVFGVSVESFEGRATFFYGEPLDDPEGDHLCRVAQWKAGTFKTFAAQRKCFASYETSRKRVGRVIVGGPSFALLSPDDQYGGGMIFDAAADALRPICGHVLTFSLGLANTHVGGVDGLLGTIFGSGGTQTSIDAFRSSNLDFKDLSVASDGAAWVRTESTTACGSVSDRMERFDRGEWRPVAAPQLVQSGKSLAALSFERAMTLAVPNDTLVSFANGQWREVGELEFPWTISARAENDVWIGGNQTNFGHFDGEKYVAMAKAARGRQVEQIVAVDDEVWMVAVGYTQEDTDRHVLRWAKGELTEWNQGVPREAVHVSALDRTHVWISGSPARAFDGEKWTDLPFSASNVWARRPDEVWFTKWGDIFRWNGEKLERTYHGFIPIMHLSGAGEHAFAVGSGGLTIELGEWADTK